MKITGNRCQCAECGEYFNGARPFDIHRAGAHGLNRRCLTVAELEGAGYMRNAAGFWCERADPNAKPDAHGLSSRFAPSARVTLRPATSTPELQAPAGAA